MPATDKIPFREKFCYGFGDLASVLYWQTFSLYLLYFYTDVFKISAVAAGTMFLVSRIWDGVNDPMMGMIGDRTETRWGKFRPYLLWLCVPFSVMGVLMFTTPHFGSTGKLIWAYVTFNGMMMIYTAINIPYTSMLGVISPNPEERTILSSVKFVFAYISATIVSVSLLPMASWLGGGRPDSAHGWQLSFIIYGVAAILFFLVVFSGTRERVRPPPAQKTPILRDLRQLFTNGPWLVLVACTVTMILFVATRLTISAHYFRYYVGPQTLTLPLIGTHHYDFTELVSAFNTVGGVASLAGAFMVGWFANRVGKKPAFLMLFTVAVVSTAAFYYLKPDQVGWMFSLQIIGSVTGGPLSVILWAMYADTADYAEWKNRSRATGLVFSASTMTQKFGWAVGGFLAGVLLSTAGYVPDKVQNPKVLHNIVLLMSYIPAVVGVVSMAIILFYPLNEKRVHEIEAELKARRGPEAAPAAV